MLWHRRLRHFHHTALLFMKKNDLGEGLPELEVKPPTCVACIEHQLTTPYTPQQNGVVERKNRTLMEMTSFATKTPFEAWYGYKPRLQNLKHLVVFVSLIFHMLRETNWIRKSLSNIYQRCNVAIIEPTGYEEAATDKKWMDAMNEELKMIEKTRLGS
ncbi:hypothetical protein AAG906_028059 [Vitis piasezkii]